MKRMIPLSLFFIPLLLACKPGNQVVAPAAVPSTVAVQTAPTNSGDVLARVNGVDITDAEVTGVIKKRLQKIESQIFDIKRDGLEDIIEDKLIEAEAKKQGIDPAELVKKELTVEEPSEQEIESFYAMFKQRFGNKTIDEVKPQLVAQLRATKSRAMKEQFIDRLKKEAKVEVLMERPRIEISVDDDPSQGPKDAPITIVEFSEFQCPYCKRTRETLKQIMETYKDKVHYVFRDFPLSFHKMAPKAAEAANCAGDQGKYWEYNTALFEHQPDLAEDRLKVYAKDLGLNTTKFEECLSSGKFAAEIEKDISDGAEAGVSGTPAYFINGIFLSGAQPFENFKAIIDDELARKK